MSGLGAYLDETFRKQQAELERTRRRIRKVAETFSGLLIHDEFPYEVKRNQRIETSGSYSQSTNAMILFALAAVTGRASGDSPLIPKGLASLYELTAPLESQLFGRAWAKLQTQTDTYARLGQISWSPSFGWDDPFTLMWLFELARAKDADSSTLRTRIARRARQRANSALRSPYASNGDQFRVLDWEPEVRLSQRTRKRLEREGKAPRGNAALEHAFPILRFVHLQTALGTQTGGLGSFPASAGQFLEARLRGQLSTAEIPDGGFDASEMVFALEGLLFINPQALGVELLNRVFQVISESQVRNPYWRPIKPFVSTPRGHVLFPLSVETANSLLRCCALLDSERSDVHWFTRNVELFTRYAAWLDGRYREGRTESGKPFAGWHSEHVHLHDGIHLWETSQVLLFLSHYSAMLDRHIAASSLDAAHLSITRPWKDNQKAWYLDYWRDDNRKVGEPLAGLPRTSPWRLFDHARKFLLEPRLTPVRSGEPRGNEEQMQFSLLLYGPPGTGKTSFAEELCRSLKWPLVTVTPSDFISGGESEVESRAKAIFDVLNAQSNVVVLFDEIDKMLLDRNSKEYGEQGDIFKFMTPSMLTKLANLRKLKRVIFIVATNYGEKIDSAAKRRGRLDAPVPLLPPDNQGRFAILAKLVGAQVGCEPRELGNGIQATLRRAANKIPLMVFSELELLFQDALRDVAPATSVPRTQRWNRARLAAAIRERAENSRPEISLSMYRSRFEGRASRPFDEFLMLLYLRVQSDVPLSDEEKDLVGRVCRQLSGLSDDDWSAAKLSSRRTALTKRLNEIVKHDSRVANVLLRSLTWVVGAAP